MLGRPSSRGTGLQSGSSAGLGQHSPAGFGARALTRPLLFAVMLLGLCSDGPILRGVVPAEAMALAKPLFRSVT